ncbi:hypothetical protein Bca52824_027485 [Brassica carinata]|uniref:Replication factor A C-terminal domain-containing protein n=1 Tax=Brassica carinata TaxID=52824 RepID=A0A8X8AQB1_BRACI|nr:hypothetical protein Bca52824_027485 [Brassica carinata]
MKKVEPHEFVRFGTIGDVCGERICMRKRMKRSDADHVIYRILLCNLYSSFNQNYNKLYEILCLPDHSLLRRLVARDTGLPSAATLLRSYEKVVAMTIAELNSFIVSATSQEIDFICTGRVVRVDTEKGWCYVACSKCSKKLHRTVLAFTCVWCNNSHAVGALRSRVEMAIADDTAEGTFVWFDGVMTKLHNLLASEAVQMLAEEGVNPEDSKIPPFIEDMEGKAYTFQVRVTAYNFTENHKTFTITCIVE